MPYAQARQEGVIAMQQARCSGQPTVSGFLLQYFSTVMFPAHARHSAVMALQQTRGFSMRQPLVLGAFLQIFSTVVCFWQAMQTAVLSLQQAESFSI